MTAPICVASLSASMKRRVMRQKRSWSPLLGKMGPLIGSQNSGSRISTWQRDAPPNRVWVVALGPDPGQFAG